MSNDAPIENIINLTRRIVDFWSSSEGWAPLDAENLMSKSRLDRHLSLTESLEYWVQKGSLTDGELILAWANLGALVEGCLKLFLSVHYEDYKIDIENFKKKNGNTIDPDILRLEQLRQYFVKKGIVSEWHDFIEHVQNRRNAIHAYKDKNIGCYSDFKQQVNNYYLFMTAINAWLPYPDYNYP